MSQTSGSKFSAGSTSTRNNRDSDRGRERDREYRRIERDRSRDRSERQRSDSPPMRRRNRSGSRDRDSNSRSSTRRRDRETSASTSRRSRFNDGGSPTPGPSTVTSRMSSLIREKDLHSAPKFLGGYNSHHYGASYHYGGAAAGHYGGGFPSFRRNPEAEARAKERDRDLKKDPLFQAAVDACVKAMKIKGDYDDVRKECFSDIDTKAAFCNLHNRIKTTVDKYLSLQVFKKDMDKVKTREGMRKKILDTPYFERGIEAVVDQILRPKVASMIRPRVEEEVYKHLKIKREGVDDSYKSRIPDRIDPLEMKIAPVIATKEISFDIIKETKPIVFASSSGGPMIGSFKAEKKKIEARSSESEEDMDIDSDSSEEEVATPLYSPAGKTPVPSDEENGEGRNFYRHSDIDEDESKGSLQIDDAVQRSSSSMEHHNNDTEDSVSISVGKAEENEKTPTPPTFDEPASPNIPPSDVISSSLSSSMPTHSPLPVTGTRIPPIPSSRLQAPSPPPPGDDAACSSPPPSQRGMYPDFSRPPPQLSQAVSKPEEDGDEEEEPLPPGEEPESYFRQLRENSYSPMKAIKRDTGKEQSDLSETQEDDEIEEDSEEESPMFEKIGEVSPPRIAVAELQDSALVQELSKAIMSQVSGSEKSSPLMPSNSNSNSMAFEEKVAAVLAPAPQQTPDNKLPSPVHVTQETEENKTTIEKAESVITPLASLTTVEKQTVHSEINVEGREAQETTLPQVPVVVEDKLEQDSNPQVALSATDMPKQELELNKECRFLEAGIIPENYEYKISYYKRIPKLPDS